MGIQGPEGSDHRIAMARAMAEIIEQHGVEALRDAFEGPSPKPREETRAACKKAVAELEEKR